MCLGFSEPTCFPVFGTEALQGIATDQWIWMNIAKKRTLFLMLLFFGKGSADKEYPKEFWQVSPYFLDAKGNIEEAAEAFDLDEEYYLRDLLAPLARKYKLEVQVLDGRFFFARKTAWKIEVCPWKAQLHQKTQPVSEKTNPSLKLLTAKLKIFFKEANLTNTVKKTTVRKSRVYGSAAEDLILP